MSYAHYQHAQPGWGTPQYQFGPPPTPAFQSQPSWRGMDFYRAHARTPDFDPSLFDNAWNRVRSHSESMSGGIGVGTHEAKHWHRRAYGGVGELSRMQPEDIGHAAAYEAYRTWIHNSSIYEPLSGDTARQREGLIGLAIGEATRLLPYTGRQLDHHARRTASEAAADTASLIFYENRDRADGNFRSHSRAGSHYDDPYAYDDGLGSHRHRSRSRHRSHSRHHSRSRSRPPPQIIMPGAGYSPMPGSSYPSSGYASSGVSASFPTGGYPSSYGGGNMPMPIHATSYPSSAVPMPVPGVASSYHSTSMPVVLHRDRSSSMSYAQNPYLGTAMSGGMAPQTIVVTKSRKHKHHHHHHSRSRRSRSSDRY